MRRPWRTGGCCGGGEKKANYPFCLWNVYNNQFRSLFHIGNTPPTYERNATYFQEI